MLTYLLAVLAACANATSSVLQRKAGQQAPRRQNLSPKLIWSLAHQPVWFGGILAVFAGFLLQASALGNGQLSVVEPILVLELPITLVLASRVFGSRLHRREWGSTAAMTAGLAGLLYFLSPSQGRPDSVRWYGWVTGIGINLAFVAALVAWGRRGPAGSGPRSGQSSALQAAVLAVAAVATFGLTAVGDERRPAGRRAAGPEPDRPGRFDPVGRVRLPRAGARRVVHRAGRGQRPGHVGRRAGAGPLPAAGRRVRVQPTAGPGPAAAGRGASAARCGIRRRPVPRQRPGTDHRRGPGPARRGVTGPTPGRSRGSRRAVPGPGAGQN